MISRLFIHVFNELERESKFGNIERLERVVGHRPMALVGELTKLAHSPRRKPAGLKEVGEAKP